MARALKDSGIPWIGEIPEGWDIVRLKSLFSFGKGLPITKENLIENGIPVISYGQVHAKNNSGVRIQDDLIRFVAPSYINTNPESLVHIGDFIFADTSEDVDGCGNCVYVDKDMTLFAGYHTLTLISNTRTDNKYIAYLIKTDPWRSQIRANVSGVKVYSISRKILSDAVVICPPTDKQKQIVSFLDAECSRIDAVIEKTRASIEEYKKLKQAVITEAVTKGIRPGRKMKDSGIEWIGEIPEEWEVLRKISYASNKSISYGIVKLFEPDDTDGVKVLRCSDIREGKIVTENIRTVTKEVSNEYGRTILNGGEVVINVRGTLGGCAVVPPEMKGYNIAREVAMVSLGNTIHNRYLMYYFLSAAFMSYENRFLAGSVYVGLNIELLSACPIPFPQYNEQEEIANYLDARSQEYDALIQAKERVVDELEKYKKSVIYEYVTGKREVL